jgi:trk system potassium uptake protein TrkA
LIGDVDVVIIGLDGIEASMFVLVHLRDSGIKNIIVKAMNDDHARILKATGATEVTYPEKDVALKLANYLSTPPLIEHIPLTPESTVVEITPLTILSEKH